VNVEFLARFEKDLGKLEEQGVLDAIADAITNVENAESVSEIRNLKKLKGFKTAYRIRIGEYRIGLFIENNVVEFARVVHRKDIYKYFP
jgi:mRNA interferase RelE/StbE